MGSMARLRGTIARGVKAALGRSEHKKAVKARRKRPHQAASAGKRPDTTGIGMPGGRFEG